LKRSRRRRSITLTINEDGLRVGAPWRASQTRIEHVLELHKHWIRKKIGEWQARQALRVAWQGGATLMLLGEPLVIRADPALARTARTGFELQVAAHADAPDVIERESVGWLRSTAQQWFESRTRHFARILGVRQPVVRLSNARTRWGSCHPAGRVHLNWRLIQAPASLIDYVVVHELSHLHEANHSARFWHWVATVLPDYQERRRALRLEAHRYLVA
jgi:predicted metal-dependent hydrolase